MPKRESGNAVKFPQCGSERSGNDVPPVAVDVAEELRHCIYALTRTGSFANDLAVW